VQLRKTFGSKAQPLTRKQAEQAIRNMEPAAAPAASLDGRTFGSVLDEWLEWGRTTQGKRWAPQTAHTNRGMVQHERMQGLRNLPLAALSAADLERAYTSWSDAGLSDNSIHRLAALISSALSFAVRRDYIPTSPAARAVAPAATKSTKRIPTAGEVGKLLHAAESFGKDMAPAIVIAAMTGARAGEVCALRWADVDLKRGRIRIDKSATEVDGLVSIKGTKTGDERIARVENGNLVVLQTVIGTPGKADEYVIGGTTEPVNPGVISDRFVSVRGLAHLRNIGFHSLRKFYVTSLLSAGVSAHAVAKSVGWKGTRMIDAYAGATLSGFDQVAAVELLPAP
jgi:integrase